MARKHHLIIALTVMVLLGGLAAGTTSGRPEMSLFLPDNRVDPGEEVTLDVYILNGGTMTLGSTDSEENSRVTTARRVRLLMSPGRAPIDVKTAEKPVGNVPEGVTGPVRFAISVKDNAKPKEYRIPIRLKYKYTHQISEGTGDTRVHQEKTATTTKHVTLRVERAARFEILDADLGRLLDDTGNVTVTVRNTGSANARDARLTITAEDDRLTFDGAQTATTFIGDWNRGENRTVSFETRIAEGVDNRSFPIAVDITNEDTDGVTQESETRRAGVAMDGRADRFVIEETTQDLAVGDSGLIGVTIRNVGQASVDEARVTVRSNDPKLGFTGDPTTESFVGPWPAGETRDVVVKADVAADADIRPYSISAIVSYRKQDGERRTTDPLVTGIVPRPEQSFEIRRIQSTLTVGKEGRVSGEIVNTGEQRIRNAVVLFETDNRNVNPVDTEYQVGTLPPNDPVPFEFDMEISDNAGSGPRQFTVRVRYRDTENDIQRSDPLDLNVSVGPKQDTFAVEPVAAQLPLGETATLEVRVTNMDDERLTDISAKLFTNNPLSSSDDEAFISALDPGESETIIFSLTADRAALTKVYPVDMDFQYIDEDGDTHLSTTYKVPVEVIEPPSDNAIPLPIVIGIVILIVIAAGGYYWWRRR